jgi:hypothetical protein
MELDHTMNRSSPDSGSTPVTVTIYASGDGENTPEEVVHHALAYAHKAGFIDGWSDPVVPAQSTPRDSVIEECAKTAEIYGVGGIVSVIAGNIRVLKSVTHTDWSETAKKAKGAADKVADDARVDPADLQKVYRGPLSSNERPKCVFEKPLNCDCTDYCKERNAVASNDGHEK